MPSGFGASEIVMWRRALENRPVGADIFRTRPLRGGQKAPKRAREAPERRASVSQEAAEKGPGWPKRNQEAVKGAAGGSKRPQKAPKTPPGRVQVVAKRALSVRRARTDLLQEAAEGSQDASRKGSSGRQESSERAKSSHGLFRVAQ